MIPKKLFYGFIIFVCCLIAFLVFNMIRFEIGKNKEAAATATQHPPVITQQVE